MVQLFPDVSVYIFWVSRNLNTCKVYSISEQSLKYCEAVISLVELLLSDTTSIIV